MTDGAAVHGCEILTNHGHVMLALHRHPQLRQRDIAELVGITEGAIQRILSELHRCGYVDVERVGRRNRYVVHPDLQLRHPLESGHTMGELLDTLSPARPDPRRRVVVCAASHDIRHGKS